VSDIKFERENMNLSKESIQEFKRQFKIAGVEPTWHIVLGSGFGAAMDSIAGTAQKASDAWVCRGEFSFEQIPGMVPSTVVDHAGKYRIYANEARGKAVLVQLGRLHGYEGHPAAAAISPVMLGRLSGISKFVLTNAAGGLDPKHHVGDVMVIQDHVNMTGQNPLTGPNPTFPDGTPLGPRFPDMSALYDPEWRAALKDCLKQTAGRVHEGVYLGLLGPSFETHAEVALFSRWGVSAVGMSTVWEAIALRHSGAKLVGLSLISNAAAGMGDGAPLQHEKIIETCRISAQRILQGVLKWIEKEPEKAL